MKQASSAHFGSIDSLGVDVRDVQGVISQQPLTPVPLAPQAVRGLMNLRGEVIAGIDLRPCLNLKRPSEDGWVNIILNGSSGPVSLLVDEIGDVIEVNDSQLEEPPETLPKRMAEITDKVCPTTDGMMLLLDVEKVIDMASGLESEY